MFHFCGETGGVAKPRMLRFESRGDDFGNVPRIACGSRHVLFDRNIQALHQRPVNALTRSLTPADCLSTATPLLAEMRDRAKCKQSDSVGEKQGSHSKGMIRLEPFVMQLAKPALALNTLCRVGSMNGPEGRQCEFWGAIAITSGRCRPTQARLEPVHRSLDLERDVTNVIPLKPNGEGLNPTQVIDRLHELCEKLQQVKSEAQHLEKLLHHGPQATKQAYWRAAPPARQSCSYRPQLMRSLRQSPN